MNTNPTDEIIRLAISYAEINGLCEPTGKEFLTAAVAAAVSPDNVRKAADVAMTVWGNQNPIVGNLNPTLAEKAAVRGKAGKKARALMKTGKYTGNETLSNRSGQWEMSK